MFARFIRLTLAVELAAYAGLGAWLHFARGYPLAGVVAGAILVALGARAALVGLTALLGWIHRSPCAPAHQVPATAMPRYLLGEYRALLADNFWYLPFESWALRPDPAPAPCPRTPVVLVHGYMSNRGYFRPLARWLESQGMGPVYAPNFPVLFTTIEEFAAELHREIERIATGCAQPRVILVCHSMGGLAAREYLREHGAGRVARLITIASPHHGTAVAALGVGRNARQMHRGSEFLERLHAAECASAPGVPTLSIWSPHDNLVAPQETCRLAWAREHAIPGVGHVEIIGSPRTFAVLREELAA
jgi:pimeloyl-ACP methyl ester carboxylesterase